MKSKNNSSIHTSQMKSEKDNHRMGSKFRDITMHTLL